MLNVMLVSGRPGDGTVRADGADLPEDFLSFEKGRSDCPGKTGQSQHMVSSRPAYVS